MTEEEEEVRERLVRDLHDLSEAKRKKAKALENMARGLAAGEMDVREFVKLCEKRQIAVEVLPRLD